MTVQSRTVEPGGQFDLRYRLAIRRAAWAPDSLNARYAEWRKSVR